MKNWDPLCRGERTNSCRRFRSMAGQQAGQNWLSCRMNSRKKSRQTPCLVQRHRHFRMNSEFFSKLKSSLLFYLCLSLVIMFFTTNNVDQNVEASWLHEASLGQLEKRGSLHEWHLSPASRKTLTVTTFRFSSSFFHCSTQSSIRTRPCAHEDDAENEERQLTSLAPDDDRPHGSNAGTAGAADDQKHRNDRRGRNARKRPETKPKAPQWVWRDGTRWNRMEHGQMGWFWFEVTYHIYLYKRILSYIIYIVWISFNFLRTDSHLLNDV